MCDDEGRDGRRAALGVAVGRLDAADRRREAEEANEQRGGPTGVQRPSACQALEAIQDAREGSHRVAGLDEEASPTDPTIAARSEKAANNTSKVTPWRR